VLSELTAFERDGLQQRSDGVTTEFITLDQAAGGTAVVHHCTRATQDDGIVDIESGEFVFQRDEPHRVTGSQLALTELEDGRVDWRIVGSFVVTDVDCP
jgi:hypothetical protein